MALTKVSTGMLSADVASIDLNIDANTMYIDVSNNRVGINNATPSTALDVTGSVTADTGEITRLGLGVAAHASAALNITTTDQHIRLNNGSELGVIDLDSDGELNIWAHGDGETINLKTGSGAGANVLSVVGNNVGIGDANPANGYLTIRGATTTGTKNGHIMLTGDSATDGQGPQIVFSESGGGSNFAGASVGYVRTGSNGIGDLVFGTRAISGDADTVPTERLRIDSRGAVGINAVPEAWDAAFSSVLQVGAMSVITSGGDNARIFGNAYYDGGSTYKRINTGYAQNYEQTGGTHRWYNAASGAADSTFTWVESMRIDSSGNLLVGKTVLEYNSNAGLVLRHDGLLSAVRSGGNVCNFNRLSSDGEIIQLNKDGTLVGTIGVATGGIWIGAGQGAYANIRFTNNQVHPCTASGGANDNTLDLGKSNSRWDDIYATNGTIQTSDRNEKQDIAELSDAEQRVAVATKGLLRKFRWKSSVAEKGDEARTHFGIIAQDLQAAFEAEGLDAGDYAMFINSTWTDEETGEERSRMGVRYSELLAFIIAAI